MLDSTSRRPSLGLRRLSPRTRCWLVTAAVLLTGLATAPALVAGLRSAASPDRAVAAAPPCPEPAASGAYCSLESP